MTSPLDPSQIAERCEVARRIARTAGTMAICERDNMDMSGLDVCRKGPQDFVTRVDRDTEKFLKSELASNFPNDGMIGEETGGGISDRPTWVIDPIDGTANYIRGLHHWAVSIALVECGQVKIGVVYDAPRDAAYWAISGHGAYRDEQAILASSNVDNTAALAIVGTSRREKLQSYLEILIALDQAEVDIRRLGSAALGLVRVAEGAAEIYYEAVLNSWDVLAGLLIAQEAGALALCPQLDLFLQASGPVLCGNNTLVSLIRQAAPQNSRHLIMINSPEHNLATPRVQK